MPSRALRADRDAHVAEDAPGANHGAAALLRVESKDLFGAANKRVLVAFDLGALPAGAVRVTQAVLRLTPQASARGRELRCHEVTGAWTEDGVTWSNQPGVGADHGACDSGAALHEWDVTASVQARFPRGKPAFRVKDDAEGALTSQLQTYASREGDGEPPEFVVTYEAAASADLASFVKPRQHSRAKALPCALTVRRASARFQQVKRVALATSGGQAAPRGVAYDAGRDAFWVTDPAAAKVRLHKRRTLALEKEYAVAYGFQPAGCAWDGTHLWLSDDSSGSMTIRKFRVDAAELVELASYPHDFRGVLAWDGSTLWSADPVGGLVTRHRLDDALSVESEYVGLPEVWGLAFPTDNGDAFTLENVSLGSPDYRLRRRRASDFALLQEWAYRGRAADGPTGLAFAPGLATAHLVNLEEAAGEVLVRPTVDLASTVRPGNLRRTADLGASVRPANVPDSADLASRVRAYVRGLALLPSSVWPRRGAAAVLGARVRPREREVTARAKVCGIVATPIVVDAQDFLDISTEVGSSITHASGGAVRSLRRVVQLVDTRETEVYPREVTSEHGRPSTQDVLRRGDAVLFATGADAFRPGDVVTWQGRPWVVVGVLGCEMVGDVRVYQEVGLRRLAVTARARVQGTVARAT